MKKYWIRLNVIFGYPLMLLLDCMICLTTDENWIDQRNDSDQCLYEIWHKYD